MATKKAVRKAKGASRGKKLGKGKKMKAVKTLIELDSFSFGASNPA